MTEEKKSEQTVDFDKLNEVYQQETGQTKEEVQNDNRRSLGALGVKVKEDDDGIADTFCDAWPKAMAFFNFAFMFGAWMPGMSNLVVMAKGVIAAVDKSVVPVICRAKPSRSSSDKGAVSGGGKSSGGGSPTRRDPIHR